MTTQPNEALVEAVALGLLNSDRAMAGLPPVKSREGIRDSDGYVVNARAIIPIVQKAVEGECAALTARYYRREIGILMQQAAHWAEKDHPFAVHHRVNKADNFYQIVSLMERDPEKGRKPPFDEMRSALERSTIYPPGAYPPPADLHRYRDARFAVAVADAIERGEHRKGG